MNEIEFLRNIIDNLCKKNPLVFKVGGIPNNVDVNFTTSVDTLHAWKKFFDKVVPNNGIDGRDR